MDAAYEHHAVAFTAKLTIERCTRAWSHERARARSGRVRHRHHETGERVKVSIINRYFRPLSAPIQPVFKDAAATRYIDARNSNDDQIGAVEATTFVPACSRRIGLTSQAL